MIDSEHMFLNQNRCSEGMSKKDRLTMKSYGRSDPGVGGFEGMEGQLLACVRLETQSRTTDGSLP